MGAVAPQRATPGDGWIKHASPAPGRSFLPYVETKAAEVRKTIDAVAAVINGGDAFEMLYAPRVDGLGFTTADARLRLARAVTATWLTGFAVGAFGAEASLADAERWFSGVLTDQLPAVAPALKGPQLPLRPNEAFALLPYLLDRHQPGTRRELLRNVDSRDDRNRRKRDGIFYTPGDVAQTMVELLDQKPGATSLDPACGTGVFLRQVIDAGLSPAHEVFGIDIDETSVEAATFVVLAAALRAEPLHPCPWALWHELRLNFACLNSLTLTPGDAPAMRIREVTAARRSLAGIEVSPPAKREQPPIPILGWLFPRLAEGADVVISNPPYAQIGSQASKLPVGAFDAYVDGIRWTSRIEAAFVEFLWRLAKSGGSGALVLPLSVGSSSRREFVRIREQIERKPGIWKFAFFDRAPDALFGDDVKTRNAILVYDGSPLTIPARILTTSLLRWTSRSRAAFLQRLGTFTEVPGEIGPLVPKLGSSAEASLYRAVRCLPGHLSDAVVDTRTTASSGGTLGASDAVFVAPTAYNWLSVARDLDARTQHAHTSASGMLQLNFQDAASADAAFAILASRVLLWLWRVESDGFHVTNTFVLNTPFSLAHLDDKQIARLADVGSALWKQALDQPTISVNRGRTSVGYATSALPLADAVDRAVTEAFRLPAAVANAVRTWYDNLVVVDFAEPRRRR